jgi:hypothetical protein
MGEVVAFRSQARRRASESKPEGPAQILFFLGVRYCRPGNAGDKDYKDAGEKDTADAGSNRRRRPGTSAPRPRRRKRA